MVGERGPEVASPQRRGPPDGLADLGKVIPFSRGRRPEANQEPTSDAASDIVPPVVEPARTALADRASGREPGPLLALLALSALVHAGALMLLNREPQPMASTRLDAISVEIVVGADAPAAPQVQPDPVETAHRPPEPPTDQSPVPPDTPPNKVDVPSEQQAAAETEQSPVQPDMPPNKVDTAPDTTAPQQMPEHQPATEAAMPPAEMTAPAALAPPEPVPTPAAAMPAEPAHPDHAPPAHQPVQTERRPAQKPAPTESKHKPAESKKVAALPPDRGSPRSHSENDPNYRGLVAAHLQRYKPSGRSEQGSVVVSFTLDGSGRVTRVALAHASGVAAIDQDAEAMVHRASPFPAPPDGRPISFTVPVNFHPR